MQVPQLILETEEDVRRFYDGRILKKMRRQITEVLSTEVKSISEDEMINLMESERCIIGYPK